MSVRNTNVTYGGVAKFFHWIIFFLVLAMIPLGFLMGDIGNKELKIQIINIHKLTGILILTLMILRALWALLNVKPMLPLMTPLWEKISERSMHFLLYLGLIIMPLSGWMGSVWSGKFPHIFNFKFYLPLKPNKKLAGFAFDFIHNQLAIILIVLISIHILAALYHYFIRKDNVLQRML